MKISNNEVSLFIKTIEISIIEEVKSRHFKGDNCFFKTIKLETKVLINDDKITKYLSIKVKPSLKVEAIFSVKEKKSYFIISCFSKADLEILKVDFEILFKYKHLGKKQTLIANIDEDTNEKHH